MNEKAKEDDRHVICVKCGEQVHIHDSLSGYCLSCAGKILAALNEKPESQLTKLHNRLEGKYKAAQKNLENNPEVCGGKDYLKGYMEGLLDAMAYCGNHKSVVMNEKPESRSGLLPYRDTKEILRQIEIDEKNVKPAIAWTRLMLRRTCKEIDRLEAEKKQQAERIKELEGDDSVTDYKGWARKAYNDASALTLEKAHLQARVRELEAELSLYRKNFCEAHQPLDSDTYKGCYACDMVHMAERIKEYEAKINELKEYKFMYEGLCK